MGNKLYVGNLPYTVRDGDLEQSFSQFGAVTSAKVMMERDTGRSKGFGFVEMGSDAEAQAAIEGMNGQPMGGRSLVVNEARPMEPRRPPRSGGFGGGGGGGGLHAEQHFEYHRHLHPGDVLSATVKPGKTWEKESKRAGKLVFSESITEYRDQHGELVITARGVGVRTERPVDSK